MTMFPRDEHDHPLCPVDGEPLSGTTKGLRQPTVYRHRSGAWHVDPLSEVASVLTIPDDYWTTDG